MTPTTSSGAGDTGRPAPPASAAWTDEAAFERAEDARVDQVESDDVLEDAPSALPDEADEADVLEQHQEIGEDDEDEAPRGEPS